MKAERVETGVWPRSCYHQILTNVCMRLSHVLTAHVILGGSRKMDSTVIALKRTCTVIVLCITEAQH